MLNYKFDSDLDQLVEECAKQKRTAITMCENIADIEGWGQHIYYTAF